MSAADIFISYTSSDRAWAFWIADELKALGHTPRVHEWEIAGGDDVYAWMEQRHDAADHVLCVLSDEYLKAEASYSKLERNAALWQAAGNRPGFVLLVAVKPCRLPTLADHIRRCELYGLSPEQARERFRDFMAKRDMATPIAFPGEAFAVSNIPVRVPEHFLGREEPLAEIETALTRDEGRVAITALHGLRGVGKTTLAAAYAERHRGDYRATWWIRAQTEPTMRADLVGLGVRLKWIAPDEKEEPALATVMERLRNEGTGLLLIYDNAVDGEALRPYLPRGGAARILVTSNTHAWRGVAQPVELRLWPKEIGADYLVARTGRRAERAAALILSQALDGLPLAHEQAAAFCERLDISFDDYLARFRAAPATILDDSRHAPADYHDGLTVAKTFALAIEKAAKLHPAAEPLIVHAALLAPEPIPLFVFTKGREKLGEPLASALAGDGLVEAVAALRTFALVDRETIVDERDPTISTDCIRLHRLVREVAQARIGAIERARLLGALVDAMAAAYDLDVLHDPATWPKARRLDALAMALVGGASDDPKAPETESASSLMDRLASYRQGVLAAYGDAKPLFERALAIDERIFGRDHPGTTTALNNLALLLRFQGELAAARPFFERALAIREKALGPEHPDTATSLFNLAVLLQAEGRLAAARANFERALAIREKALGPEHHDTATSLNSLGHVLRGLGERAAARSVYERALAIDEKMLGPDHPDTASALSGLGILLRDLDELAAARPLQERALAIYEKVLGSEHPHTATALANLASVLRAQGELGPARTLQERALDIFEKVPGTGHPNTARVRCNLAALLLASGEPAAALPLAEAALAVHDEALGRDHAWTKDSARVCSESLEALGRTDEAAALRAEFGLEGVKRPP